jgi:glycosyltransferase involved in cell wall biosynthesis
MKTILVLHRGGDQIRGSEVCLIETIEALFAAGYKIIVLRKDACIDQYISGQVETILDEAFPEIMLDGSHRSFPLVKYSQSLYRLYKLARLYKPSVVYCNTGLPCQLAVPVGRLLNIPVLCHFHHPASRRYFYIWLVKYATKLIFPSNYTRSVVEEKCGRSGEVVYNAVNMKTRFVPAVTRDRSFLQKHHINESAIVVGQVASLTRHKRQDILVRSFANALLLVDSLHLVLVGDGPMYDELGVLIHELGLDQNVTLAGYVPDVLPYYQHVFDINVLASSEEGLGISVIEASACALPSIVTDCTGLREVVDNGITGLTFDSDNFDQLTDGIVRLANDPDLRRRLGQAARAKAVKTFSLEHYKEKIVHQVENM